MYMYYTFTRACHVSDPSFVQVSLYPFVFICLSCVYSARPTISNMQRMVQAPISYHTRQKDVAGPMLNETRDMLRKWFQPWNEELALLLEDSGYLWEDTNVTDIE